MFVICRLESFVGKIPDLGIEVHNGGAIGVVGVEAIVVRAFVVRDPPEEHACFPRFFRHEIRVLEVGSEEAVATIGCASRIEIEFEGYHVCLIREGSYVRNLGSWLYGAVGVEGVKKGNTVNVEARQRLVAERPSQFALVFLVSGYFMDGFGDAADVVFVSGYIAFFDPSCFLQVVDHAPIQRNYSVFGGDQRDKVPIRHGANLLDRCRSLCR